MGGLCHFVLIYGRVAARTASPHLLAPSTWTAHTTRQATLIDPAVHQLALVE